MAEDIAVCQHFKILRDADKSLAFPVCSTAKRIFLGWVKEVCVELRGEYVE
jgi:hypothetical protein